MLRLVIGLAVVSALLVIMLKMMASPDTVISTHGAAGAEIRAVAPRQAATRIKNDYKSIENANRAAIERTLEAAQDK